MDIFWLFYEQTVWCELETKVLFISLHQCIAVSLYYEIFFGNLDNLLSLNLLFSHLNQIIVQSGHLFSLWCIFYLFFSDETLMGLSLALLSLPVAMTTKMFYAGSYHCILSLNTTHSKRILCVGPQLLLLIHQVLPLAYTSGLCLVCCGRW